MKIAPTQRVVVIGDIGGQLQVFWEVLKSLGVDSHDLIMPADVIAVQVGDVARVSDSKDLASDECILLVDELMRRNPSQYFQLIGNHEIAMLGDFYIDRPGARKSQIIENWWYERKVRFAIGLRVPTGEEILITHAGLSRGQWTGLQRPSLEGAVEALNARVGHPINSVVTVGALVTGLTNPNADVAWAEVNYEIYLPWIENGDLPFQLVHGHASPYSWQALDWWPDTPSEVRLRTKVLSELRRTSTDLSSKSNPGSREAISVDWALGDRESHRMWPLLEFQASEILGTYD